MPIYHHQIHTLKAGASVPRLYEAIQHEYLPLIEELDVRIVGYWETTDIQGTSNETIAVWEFDDYRHLERFVRA